MPIKVMILLIEVFLGEISDFHEKEIISLVAIAAAPNWSVRFNVLCSMYHHGAPFHTCIIIFWCIFLADFVSSNFLFLNDSESNFKK